MKTNKKSNNEIIFYIIIGVIFAIGLTFLIFGIIGDHVPTSSYIKKMQESLSWRYIGMTIIIVATLLAVIELLVYAKRADRVNEKALRRKQRLNAMMSDINSKNDTMIVSEGKIVKEEKVETIDDSDSSLKEEDVKPINK